MGSDPLNEKELQFVNEAFATPKPLKVIPHFCFGLRLGGPTRVHRPQPRHGP
ncbi:hypothetical protein ACVWYH_002025 [Bradyrhizobium sp. GM24.11]